MEEANSPRGFPITAGKIPIIIALKKTTDLKPHEETVAEDLDGIVRALRRDPVLRHPIIADVATGAVLDGTHRLAAVEQLGCRTIPAALLDYQHPLVHVERWFRTIKGPGIGDLLQRTERLSPVSIPVPESDRSLLARSCYATLRDKKECLAFKSNDSEPLRLCKRAFELEQIAKESDGKIVYVDNGDNLPESTVLMSTIRLEKREVLESCQRRQLFPPKSTRHLIPSRPLGLNVPLRWLKEANFVDAESEFEKYLAKKTVKRLPEGSMVGSRRYMEEVFLFE